jgi:hypothetical protein
MSGSLDRRIAKLEEAGGGVDESADLDIIQWGDGTVIGRLLWPVGRGKDKPGFNIFEGEDPDALAQEFRDGRETFLARRWDRLTPEADSRNRRPRVPMPRN